MNKYPPKWPPGRMLIASENAGLWPLTHYHIELVGVDDSGRIYFDSVANPAATPLFIFRGSYSFMTDGEYVWRFVWATGIAMPEYWILPWTLPEIDGHVCKEWAQHAIKRYLSNE